MHLEFFKNIDFKWLIERPLGITHVPLFILQYTVLTFQYSLQYSSENCLLRLASLCWPTFC